MRSRVLLQATISIQQLLVHTAVSRSRFVVATNFDEVARAFRDDVARVRRLAGMGIFRSGYVSVKRARLHCVQSRPYPRGGVVVALACSLSCSLPSP